MNLKGEAEKLSDEENDTYYNNFPEKFKEWFANASKPGEPIDFEKYVEEMISMCHSSCKFVNKSESRKCQGKKREERESRA